ncbi:hypothetical protein AVEN_55804-1 [Araneus ventricosus]|uniref:Uncharacterized protein n=1 Tax=Araneus ventricosus TaxID=182803 RepID=A0A4Y2AEH0_ARAVE|nr:hypothetical protein AVEN_55804-1 [Araneus ventricosus]
MHLNAITDYAMPVACALWYRTVARWIKAFRASRNASVDLHRTCRRSIPQYQIDIFSGLLSIDRLLTIPGLPPEAGLGHQWCGTN